MQKFVIEGEFTKKGRKFKFKKEISAETERFAKEKLLCILGSCHKIKRRLVNIKKIEVLLNGKENRNEPAANTSAN